MKKIFIVINSLWGGGAEHAASRISNYLINDYDVHVFSLLSLTDSDYSFSGMVTSLYEDKWNIPFIREIIYARKLSKYADEENPDVIIGFLQNASLAVTMMKAGKCKRIVSIRNNLLEQYKGWKLAIWKRVIKHYFNRVDYVVSVSKAINEQMVQTFGILEPKSKYIYNMYPIKEIQEKAKETLEVDYSEFYFTHKVIINVGHVGTQKAQYRLIRILPEIRKTISNAGLVIVGDTKSNPELYDRLQKMSEELGVRDHVLFVGKQKNPFKFLKKGCIFVFPSLFEGFPNALAEAMACGLPIISSDCVSGPREIMAPDLNCIDFTNGILNTKYGALIKSDKVSWMSAKEVLTLHEKAYVSEIITLFTNEDYYDNCSLNCQIRARDFDSVNIYKEWIKLIEG